MQARLTQVVAGAVDRTHLADLLEDHALARNTMDASQVRRVREEMERAEARRLQPHYIESFFLLCSSIWAVWCAAANRAAMS